MLKLKKRERVIPQGLEIAKRKSAVVHSPLPSAWLNLFAAWVLGYADLAVTDGCRAWTITRPFSV